MLNIAIHLLKFLTDFEFHGGFAPKYDFPISPKKRFAGFFSLKKRQKKQQFMTTIENNDDVSMRNPIFIADLPKNAIFRFSGADFSKLSQIKKWQRQ